MSTPDTVTAPELGEPGERCADCRAPLAPDQRYCLNCGLRRAESRVPYEQVLPGSASTAMQGSQTPPPPAAGSGASTPAASSPMVALVGVGVVALVLGVGVLIGRSVSGSTKKASAPQVISVGGAAGTGATSATGSGKASGFKSDWPAGKDAYTVELTGLPKASTQPATVAAAKSSAEGKGAPGVGALDSDQYPSLDGGQYVVYSGVYKSQGEAAKALKGLKKNFPQAKVIHVSKNAGAGGSASTGPAKTISRQQLSELNNTSGSDYFKRSSKLPKKIAIPGPPPPKDKKPPGGGSGGGQTIG